MTKESAIKYLEVEIKKLLYSMHPYDIKTMLELNRRVTALEMGIEELKNSNRYCWHDIRDNKDDIPENNTFVILKFDYHNEFALAKYVDGKPVFQSMYYSENDIVAWKYIEEFDNEQRKGTKTMKKVIIRAKDAGVFYGELKDRNHDEVVMCNCRRIWYWSGAASLSQMAVDGVSRPEDCKFTVFVPEMTIIGVCEVIPCTEKAIKSIEGVEAWRA